MVQGACQGVCQLFWIRLRIFDTALVLLWVLQGGSSLANLPAARDSGEKVKANMHHCSHSVPLESLTLTFWAPPRALTALKSTVQQGSLPPPAPCA